MQTLFEINCGVKSDVGRVRKNNEDSITYFIPTDAEELKKNGSLFIVADGVGGAAKGEVASHFAADTVIYEYYNNEELPPAERLAKAIEHASREIFNHSQANGNFTRMATTIVAALILQNNLIVAHVGDSRLYLVREGKIKQITRDHSVVAEMVRNGLMTEEEARTSKAKNRISRSVGGEADVKVDVSDPIPLSLGDRILLCSDGLTRYLDGEELKAAVQKGDVEAVPKELIKYANSQGGVDNVSAILLEIVEKAKIHIKKPVHPKGPPEKLGWDEAQTEYGSLSSKRKKKIPIWVLIGGAIVGVVFFSGIFSLLGKGKGGEITPEAGMTATTASVVETETPEVTETTEVTEPPVQSDSQNDAGADSSGESDMSVIASTPSGQWECLYFVKVDDSLDSIKEIFGLENETEFKYYWDCNSTDGKISCSQQEDKKGILDSNEDLKFDTWLVLFSTEDNSQWNLQECEKDRSQIQEDGTVIMYKGIIYEYQSTGGNE